MSGGQKRHAEAPPYHRPRKRFGQHFVKDPGVVARMVRAIEPLPGHDIVEIGAGLGALTRPLLEKAGHLHVVELDRDLASRLAAEYQQHAGLRIHIGDALSFDFAALARHGRRLHIVGNLPYNISTPLLFHLLGQSDAIHDMHFMLQNEIVDRMVSSPGTRNYGRLSVMVQFHCRAEKLFTVKPEAFTPKPRVQSAVVRLRVHGHPPVEVADAEAFAQIVKRAFMHRRKTLRNSLDGLVTEAQIESAGVDSGARPQTLGLKEFAALANQLQSGARLRE